MTKSNDSCFVPCEDASQPGYSLCQISLSKWHWLSSCEERCLVRLGECQGCFDFSLDAKPKSFALSCRSIGLEIVMRNLVFAIPD